ncbi:MAG: Rne/Rng family ribonuclease [Coleofasciculaceae cyanobacterium SM2_1_6]|nr:Rne/Rng family ribonuclease [Coleofasciculaceae cyanobacterium SM2_1_6]
MPKQIIIAEQHRLAAVFWEDQIQELVVATGSHQVGDIYLGTVENILQGIDAAFVNIGDSERNGFIHVTDLGPLRLKRSSAAITELLTPQQKVLVQVMKEPTGNKGPRLTGNISLPGRYLVLMPYGKGVNLSQRIKNENERNRLRALAILIKPSGMGLLVRTEAEGKPEEDIIRDLEGLQKQWEAIQQEANSTRPPALLNRDDDFIQRVLRDMYTGEVNRIVVDSHAGMKRVKQHLSSWSAGKNVEAVLVDHHRDRLSILEYFRVNSAIREALKPRVELPSGGYIIIEPTEALTVIDVNSGSFTRSATSRETVLWTNCEAATEIARQLRLRNIGGVIIIDFIDMDSRRDQLQVLEHFNKALKADKSRPQIAQLSELGLVELTRKRQGQNLYELFGQTCAACGGLGHLVRLPGETEQQPLLNTTTVSSRPVARKLSPSPWEIEDLAAIAPPEMPPEEELNEYISHPTYQERGSGKERRRSNSRRTRAVEGVPEVVSSRFSKGEATPARPSGLQLRYPKPEELFLGEAEQGEEEPRVAQVKERHRLGRGKKAGEPLESIAVEMTQEEQDMYAMMGISPLVKLDREVKNPKAVQLQVVLPGELPIAPPEEEFSEEVAPVFKPERREVFSLEDFTPVLPTKVIKPKVTLEENTPAQPGLFTESAPEESPSGSSTILELSGERPVLNFIQSGIASPPGAFSKGVATPTAPEPAAPILAETPPEPVTPPEIILKESELPPANFRRRRSAARDSS